MTIEQEKQKFYAEFDALKAKYGDAFADLEVVRFIRKKEGNTPEDWRDYTPYWCRANDETGDIECEDLRE